MRGASDVPPQKSDTLGENQRMDREMQSLSHYVIKSLVIKTLSTTTTWTKKTNPIPDSGHRFELRDAVIKSLVISH